MTVQSSHKRLWLKTVVLAAALAATAGACAQQRVLRLISDRTDQGTIRPILDAFEARSGAKVEGVFMDQGLLNRLESRPTEADIVITKDAELLEIAAQRGLLDTLDSANAQGHHPRPVHGPGQPVLRRCLPRARDLLFEGAASSRRELSTYEDLANPKWKGRLCIRSGTHDYNLAPVRPVLRLLRR